MPAGLEIYDASGSLQLSLTDRVTRVLGTLTLSAAAGSTTDARLTEGAPWYWICDDQLIQIGATPGKVITISGTTITWGASNAPTKIIYGLY